MPLAKAPTSAGLQIHLPPPVKHRWPSEGDGKVNHHSYFKLPPQLLSYTYEFH